MLRRPGLLTAHRVQDLFRSLNPLAHDRWTCRLGRRRRPLGSFYSTMAIQANHD